MTPEKLKQRRIENYKRTQRIERERLAQKFEREWGLIEEMAYEKVAIARQRQFESRKKDYSYKHLSDALASLITIACVFCALLYIFVRYCV